MITALVQFKLKNALSVSDAKDIFTSTAPRYQSAQGLIRKYYILSEDGKTAGGMYLWDSKASAERTYTEEWKVFIREKYGAEPVIEYFHTPVVVDNLSGEVVEG